jgi:hypothetical protein
MKKLIILLLVLPLIILSGCKKETVALDSIYGKYYYKDCIYINDMYNTTCAEQNKLYKGVTRYSLSSKEYVYYKDKSTTPTMNIINIHYVENDVLKNITYQPVIKLLKKASTRYDIYKGENSQGFSFVFDEEKVYFLEFRYFANSSSHVLMQVVELEKRS